MKIIVLALAMVCLVGCGFSSVRCRQSVAKKYGAEVQVIPGEQFKFIARDTNGAIWFVETMNTGNAEISSEVLLFSPQK